MTAAPPVEVHEFEVWLSTFDGLHAGVVATEVVKVLAAGTSSGAAYELAVATAWRGDRQVTKVWWVP